MPLEDRGRARGTDIALDRLTNSLCPGLAGNVQNQARNAKNGRYCYRQCRPGNIDDGRERSVVHLLRAADFVQLYSSDILNVVEVNRWIVEGEMAVLTDSEKSDARLLALEQLRVAANLGIDIGGFTPQFVKDRRCNARPQPLFEKSAKRRRVFRVYADVLIQMKGKYAAPVDQRAGCQGVQEFCL